MRRLLIAAALLVCWYTPAHALDTQVVAACGTPTGLTYTVPGVGSLTVDQTGRLCANVTTGSVVTANASGTTGAVVATIPAVAGKTNNLCSFSVSATGTGSVGPITITGLAGGTQTYQLTAPGSVGQAFSPCLPASAPNVAIVITTTADATATAVNVNAAGFLL